MPQHLGSDFTAKLFAVALIAAGQSSTITGTLAGQIVMEGYLRFRMNPLLRRLITRLLAIVPAANVANVDKKAAVGLSAGKNLVEITTAKLPKIKKSYHSISVPIEEAPITFQIVFLLAVSLINNVFLC